MQGTQNFETYDLIWLDTSVNKTKDNIDAQKRIRVLCNRFLTFKKEQKCQQYIKSLSKDDRLILIVSGKLGQIIVPKIIHYRQISSIYIYCRNKDFHQKWAQNYPKVIFIHFFSKYIYRCII